MQQPVVVVDANQIIERDWRIEKPLWQVLLGLAARGQVTLFVTEFVVREYVGKFRSKLSGPAREVSRLRVPVDIDTAVADYQAVLRGRLVGAGAVVSRDEPLTLMDLVDQAISRTRPFNDDGNGFRDAILRAHVRKLAVDGNQVVFLASDDDFLEGKDSDKRLHSDLAATVAVGSVQWFPDIRSWFDGTQSCGTNPKADAQLLKLIQAERAQFDANVIIAPQHLRGASRSVGPIWRSANQAAANHEATLLHTHDLACGPGRDSDGYERRPGRGRCSRNNETPTPSRCRGFECEPFGGPSGTAFELLDGPRRGLPAASRHRCPTVDLRDSARSGPGSAAPQLSRSRAARRRT